MKRYSNSQGWRDPKLREIAHMNGKVGFTQPRSLEFSPLIQQIARKLYREDHLLRQLGRVDFVFWEFPHLDGRYCSYLLPKQDGGTSQINPTQPSQQMGLPVACGGYFRYSRIITSREKDSFFGGESLSEDAAAAAC